MTAYQEYLKRESPTYYKLLAMKENGSLFSFSDITYEQLNNLWDDEHVGDKIIGELFGVNKHAVTKKRKDFGLSVRNVVIERMMMQLSNRYEQEYNKQKCG